MVTYLKSVEPQDSGRSRKLPSQVMPNGSSSKTAVCLENDGFATMYFKLSGFWVRLVKVIEESEIKVTSDASVKLMAGVSPYRLQRLELNEEPQHSEYYSDVVQLSTMAKLRFLFVGKVIVKYKLGKERATSVSI